MPTVRTRGKLPHWEEQQAIYFVTFRLADSLPQSVLRAYQFEKQNIVGTAIQAGRPLSPFEEKRLEKLFSEKIQAKLDAGLGRCFLVKPEIADLVAKGLRYFEPLKYLMYAWCVMPNHVHALFRVRSGHTLAEVLHAWKSYSATKVNRILRRSGQFWQREYYDHIVRSEDEFYRIVNYIAENPKKARLKNRQWVGISIQS